MLIVCARFSAWRSFGTNACVSTVRLGFVVTILPLGSPVSSAGITAVLNQDRTAIDHNGLTGAESFLHQKQIGLCNIVSFADSPHRQTLAHAFKELLPL